MNQIDQAKVNGLVDRDLSSPTLNRLQPQDKAAHNWYRFVLAFPPHLVSHYLERFNLRPGQRVLDPFCGTGTTPVECLKHGIDSIGIEASPMAHFACQVKTDWTPSPKALLAHAQDISENAIFELHKMGIDDTVLPDDLTIQQLQHQSLWRQLPDEQVKLLIKGSISPVPLHKCLVLLQQINQHPNIALKSHARLAFAKMVVTHASNLRFGPEIGVGAMKANAPVISAWLEEMLMMAMDLEQLHDQRNLAVAQVHHNDARNVGSILEPNSIDALITSPPYPNEKEYSRATRLEAVLLGFIQNRAQLQTVKQRLLRSSSRSVYRCDDDHHWVCDHVTIQKLAAKIEARRVELNKTSGFEKQYARVVQLYFGGMKRHLAELRPALRPNAQLMLTVGDQQSFFQITIQTGQLLAEIAESLNYTVENLELFRLRRATATKKELREEALILRWNG